jgi:hypothetical protein
MPATRSPRNGVSVTNRDFLGATLRGSGAQLLNIEGCSGYRRTLGLRRGRRRFSRLAAAALFARDLLSRNV